MCGAGGSVIDVPVQGLRLGENESSATAKGREEKEETGRSRGGERSAGGEQPTAARERRALLRRGQRGALPPAAHGAGA